MTDRHTRTDTVAAGTAPAAHTPTETGRDPLLRLGLWLLLLAAVVGSVVSSMAGLVAVSVPLGVVVLGLGAALVVEHRRTHP
ncbi:hypothetical protein [Cellulomonas shaoxiangyii]|uniref:Uncharacterized protein n=1 Tax=Cellulomonas shaoxiangyii TaxID=2566013 RepID=A0A4V1CMB1_9CELL|nr:hypothetical protein [Cellulomonas shaoxiangyii]QCB92325.1 hypothetical protein E5225_00890 [Cellulomonas shaoxiangyii]TGY86281.1 hypothetical protein E5226_02975 [Cellulomonas shaoxiangyii]